MLSTAAYRSLVLTAVLLSAGLTGCLGGAEDDPTVEPASVPQSDVAGSPAVVAPPPVQTGGAKAATGDRPSWAVGDFWTFSAGETGVTASMTIVVTDAGPSGYVTATTSKDQAAYDAAEDSSFVGPVSRDLAGAQHGEPVHFFKWPLTDGATWSTVWDGVDVDLTAAAVSDVATPTGTEPGFRITGTTDGAPFVEYDYAPSVKWWTRASWVSGFEVTLTATGTDFAGTVFVGRGEDLLDLSSPQNTFLPPVASFDVTEEPFALEARLLIVGLYPGAYTLGIVGADGVPEEAAAGSCETIAPDEVCRIEHRVQLAPVTGTGHAAIASTVPGLHVFRVRAIFVDEVTIGGPEA